MSAGQRSKPVPKLKEVTYARGQKIFREGDLGDTTFIVAAGQVDIVKRAEDGSDQLIVRLHPGNMFGELALVLRRPRAASAIAATDCVCFALDREALNARLQRSSPFINALFRVICGNLKSITTGGFKATNRDIETLAGEDQEETAR